MIMRKNLLLTLMLMVAAVATMRAQDMEQTAAPSINVAPAAIVEDYINEPSDDYKELYRFYFDNAIIENNDESDVTIYYRIYRENGSAPDIWDVYEQGYPIMPYTEDLYVIEAYAVAPGKLESEIVTKFFGASSEVVSRICRVDGVYYSLFMSNEYSSYDYNTAWVSSKDPIESYITTYEPCYSGNIVIPSEIEFDGVSYVVQGIGNSAFKSCEVTSVELPSTLEYIHYEAFANSTIGQIFIPAKVNYMESNAFYNCSNLTSIEIDPNNITYDSRDNCNAIILKRTNSLLVGCQNSTIPNTVTSIGASAFMDCSGLETIVIPNSVTVIGSSAFAGCTDLAIVEMSDSITRIEVSAFNGCSSLTSIEFPSTLTSIGGSAFYNCSSLTSVRIPDSVTSIGSYAFYGCQNLVSVKLPSSITTISSDMFCACYSLASIEIPNTVTRIDQSAFYACRSLTSVRIPASVTNVGYVAFSGCENLTGLIMEAVTPPAASSQFYSEKYRYDQVKLFVPNESLDAYRAHSEWGKFTHIVPFIGAGPGDINGDGTVAIGDVSGMIDMLLEGSDLPAYCDVNGDGEVTIADVSALIDMLLGI